MTLYEATSIVVLAFLALAITASVLLTVVLIAGNVRATIERLRHRDEAAVASRPRAGGS